MTITSLSMHSADGALVFAASRFCERPWHDTPPPRELGSVAHFFSYSFLLHLVWENAQAPLYQDFTDDIPGHVWVCFYATATGDMAFSVILFCVLALVHQDIWWATRRLSYSHPATWILPPLAGVLLVVAFELWAIYVVRRWEYGLMPMCRSSALD